MIFQMEKLAFVAQNIWRKIKKKQWKIETLAAALFLFIVLF